MHFHFSITILLKNRELSIQGTLIGDDCNVIRHIPVKYKIFFCVLELLHGTFEDSTRSIKIDDGLRSVHRFGTTAREQHFQLLRGTALMHQFDRACRTAVILTRLSRHAFAKRPGPIAVVLMGKGGVTLSAAVWTALRIKHNHSKALHYRSRAKYSFPHAISKFAAPCSHVSVRGKLA
eukprot:COSAG01_NODE_558_length_15478_cov_217.596788_7_plen_178_part_00